ncbi:MAG: hypothetical protein LBD60_01715 [Puniceicoccales bacterium]|jgi:hypothetical protein|nr:hypothetical protein [Puniceicoccales bacterium]
MEVKGGVKPKDRVIQFTVSCETKDSWISNFVNLIVANGHYILGFMGEYGMEISCVRFITESSSEVRALLEAHGIHFCEREVIVVCLRSLDNLDGILRCLRAGEISVLYAYGLMINTQSRTGIILMVDDVVAGTEMLTRSGYEVLGQSDLSR